MSRWRVEEDEEISNDLPIKEEVKELPQTRADPMGREKRKKVETWKL